MHNEAAVIQEVLAGLRARFPVVVCVDDGSTDGTADLAAETGVTVLRHATNLGQGAALQTGITFALRATRCRYLVTFDADGQHDPDDALTLVQAAERDGVDVVLGSRFLGVAPDVPPLRRALLRGGVAFTRLTTGLRLTDTHNGLRALSRDAARRVDMRQRGMAHASEILQIVAAEGLSYREVPVSVCYTAYSQAKGQSGLNALNIVFDLLMQRLYAFR
jgi:glycosyltransferase involved in cell wall biosynthesis